MTTILKGNILHAPSFGALEVVPEGCMVLEDGRIQGSPAGKGHGPEEGRARREQGSEVAG